MSEKLLLHVVYTSLLRISQDLDASKSMQRSDATMAIKEGETPDDEALSILSLAHCRLLKSFRDLQDDCVYIHKPLDDRNSIMEKVFFLHDRFQSSFLELLKDLSQFLSGSTASNNMMATRRFFRSEGIASAILSHLPTSLGFRRVLPSMRFIEYGIGGFIAPHCDGVMFDEKTCRQSTTSFLLYLQDTNEGGETIFLSQVRDGAVLAEVAPRRGSILLFPHCTPHEGACVGGEPKVLLRGDLY